MDIWTHRFKHHSIKEELLRLMEEEPPRENRDKDNLVSDYWENNSEKKYINKFLQHIREFTDDISDRYYAKDLHIIHAWHQIYTVTGSHGWHVHGGSNISFVYYLHLENPDDRTLFWNPETRETFQPDAREGDIVIFPSHTLHTSPIIRTSKKKVIISGNMNLGEIFAPI